MMKKIIAVCAAGSRQAAKKSRRAKGKKTLPVMAQKSETGVMTSREGGLL
jgi:hypothetical protein